MEASRQLTVDESLAGLFTWADPGASTHSVFPHPRAPLLALPLTGHPRRAALAHLFTRRARAFLATRRFAAGWLFPQARGLAATSLLHDLAERGGADAACATVTLHSLTRQKATMLLLDAAGRPQCVVKLATAGSSARRLSNEAEWLRRLEGRALLEGQRPVPIAAGQVSSVEFLVESQCAGRPVPHGDTLRDEHLGLLAALQDGFGERPGFQGSQAHHDLAVQLQALRSSCSVAWSHRMERALTLLESRFTGSAPPMVAAHRDFAPWNLRRGELGLSLLDWEHSREGYPPLYDLFHYVLAPGAVRARLPLADTAPVLRRVQALGRSLTRGEAKTRCPELQLLAYLLDVSLLGLELNQGREDLMLRRHARLIDSLLARDGSLR